MSLRKLHFYSTLLLSCFVTATLAQDQARPLTMDEYKKAKTFTVADLDNDTYVKFENAYILDRYEMRKPYFITGDDGNKKRIDLYKLISKDSLLEIGLMIFYTNEKGVRYQACMPGFKSAPDVWEAYFEDIHQIDKQEANFVLKLSYVLSRECSFQLYKAMNAGKDLKEESATYGNDICFPGDEMITLANGTNRPLKEIKAGDQVVTVDPVSHQPKTVTVKALVSHAAKNYALTRLVLIAITENSTAAGVEITLHHKILEATPNHPVFTRQGKCEAGQVKEGDTMVCFDEASGTYRQFTVAATMAYAGGTQPVYNMEAADGKTFMVNGVMVSQK